MAIFKSGKEFSSTSDEDLIDGGNFLYTVEVYKKNDVNRNWSKEYHIFDTNGDKTGFLVNGWKTNHKIIGYSDWGGGSIGRIQLTDKNNETRIFSNFHSIDENISLPSKLDAVDILNVINKMSLMFENWSDYDEEIIKEEENELIDELKLKIKDLTLENEKLNDIILDIKKLIK